MAEWLGELAIRVARDERAVLVTIAHATGSTPREAGTMMVVGPQDFAGSIGGGHLEFEALRIARDALTNDPPPGAWLVRFPLAARLGQCCGGVATLAFAVLDARDRVWLERAAQHLRAGVALQVVTRFGGSGSTHSVEPNPDATEGDATLIQSNDGATLLVHAIVPSNFNVLLFGNGHVGRALAQVLGTLSARVRWIDSRDADFPTGVPANVEIVATDLPEAELRDAPCGAYVLVMTHSHALDFELIATALTRDDWRYLGLIGSQSKRNQFAKRLAARGVSPGTFARVTCPIGASAGITIRSKEPGAIAVAVAAELLRVRDDFCVDTRHGASHGKSRL
jgi:xanthine dehydrogenase accessory factor